jgi:hypothetical protein
LALGAEAAASLAAAPLEEVTAQAAPTAHADLPPKRPTHPTPPAALEPPEAAVVASAAREAGADTARLAAALEAAEGQEEAGLVDRADGRCQDDPRYIRPSLATSQESSAAVFEERDALALGAEAAASLAATPLEEVTAQATPTVHADPPPTPPTHPSPRAEAAATAAALRARMEAPFTPAEVSTLVRRTPLRKSVFGPLGPWLLKPACEQMALLISNELNSWRRAGRLPSGDASSSLALVPKPRKPGSEPPGPADQRGIAVGALLTKLYAALIPILSPYLNPVHVMWP